MKTNTGQIATEFVLVLPWLCGALLGFILLILFCVRAQLATYAGFMGSRVYGVWPEQVSGEPYREEMLLAQLNGILQSPEWLQYERIADSLVVESTKMPPFDMMNVISLWDFRTETPVVIEPMTACDGEDNKIQSAEVQPCS